jgi:succinoglycan biosynthesis protein ExoO
MSKAVSVIMPAHRAEATIAESVASVLAQTHGEFELVIAADDEADYASVLEHAGIADPRIVHVTTGRTGSGSAHARNVALAAARHRWIATLDADDRFRPRKLEKLAAALEAHPLVTTGLEVLDADDRALRQVGCTGATRMLAAEDYKRVNLSMDSMLGWDRATIPVAYDDALPCLVDLELILKAFGCVAASLHIGEPLHEYRKQPQSISNAAGASPVYADTKWRLIERLQAGRYRFVSPAARDGFIGFLRVSLAAEQSFEAARLADPDLIFEDHLEARLAGA